ncbi:MAG TPA: signal recognition particle receptor subunit alpha, partial [Pseudomonadales bacterium]|nr:signal recognition particle receptor subunit alpha [Pseudomonadales bacterium]
MFENLSERLARTLRSVAGRARLSDENISEALRDVRTALLEADVALNVVKDFVERVRVGALGQE